MKPAESKIYSPNLATKFRYNRRLEITLDLLVPHLNMQANMVDFGCGDGAWLKFVAPYIGSGLGIDLGWSGAKEAWKIHPVNIEFLHDDFMNVDLGHHPYDIATCFETLEHISNPEEVIDKMYSVLKPGGIALVSVPIEVGLSLIVKQISAFLMGYRRSQNPNEKWSFSEVLSATCFNVDTLKSRRILSTYKGHKGFDFRDIGRYFRSAFSDVRSVGTPFKLFGTALNVGVIYIGNRNK